MQNTKFSLIISTRNRPDKLSKLISFIDTELFNKYGELILVDSASTDNTLEVMKQIKSEASFPVSILSVKRPGSGLGRRLGAEFAKGELLIFMDDDCYPAEDYFAKVLEAFDKYPLDYCGGKVLLYDESDIKYTVQYSDQAVFFPPNSFIPAGQLNGCNQVFKREMLMKLGNFNPYLGAGVILSGDDTEILGRATLNGYTGAYLPDLTVYHHHGRKFMSEIKPLKKHYSLGRGAYYASMLVHGSAKNFFRAYKRSLSRMIKHRDYSHIKFFIYEILGSLSYFTLIPYYYLVKPIRKKDVTYYI